MRRRGERVERSFAHILDRGGMRRAWLRGRENIHKRYLIHVAGFNLGVLMRALHGQGTPREAADAFATFIFVLQTNSLLVFGLIALIDAATRRARCHHPPRAKRDLKTALLQRAVSFFLLRILEGFDVSSFFDSPPKQA